LPTKRPAPAWQSPQVCPADYEQTKLRSYVYKNLTKHLWIGTFHALCSRILRFDIEKYQRPEGYPAWTKNFSIFDESDAQSLVKTIVVKTLNLDDKKVQPPLGSLRHQQRQKPEPQPRRVRARAAQLPGAGDCRCLPPLPEVPGGEQRPGL
jgi:superfamily I DNA/RNA helicase